MAATHAQHAPADAGHQPTQFELRRAALVGEIGDSLEQVLAQINTLNRNLEGIIEIGNEFASVEALWSQFENVMGNTGDEDHQNGTADVDANGDDQTGSADEHGEDAKRNGRS